MNRKGQGISINMLIIIAMAVFAIFLVMGFMTGGWSAFTGKFKTVTGGGGGYDAAKVRCDQYCMSYRNAKCPTSGSLYSNLYGTHVFDTDTNDNGIMDDCFSCLGDVSGDACTTEGESISKVLGSCRCGGLVTSTGT